MQYSDLLAGAESIYQQGEGRWAPDVDSRLVELIGAARTACLVCQRPVAATEEPAATPSRPPSRMVPVSLLDPDLGVWTDTGVYFGETENGLVWYLYDRFVKRRVEPLSYVPAEGGRPYRLYSTLLKPADAPLGKIMSVRLRAKVLSVSEVAESPKPLWGVRIAGFGEQASYVLVMWAPVPGEDEAQGRWVLEPWNRGSGAGSQYRVAIGDSTVTSELVLERTANGSAYDIHWQGDLVRAKEPLGVPADLSQIELLVGEGVHIWLRDAVIEIAR